MSTTYEGISDDDAAMMSPGTAYAVAVARPDRKDESERTLVTAPCSLEAAQDFLARTRSLWGQGNAALVHREQGPWAPCEDDGGLTEHFYSDGASVLVSSLPSIWVITRVTRDTGEDSHPREREESSDEGYFLREAAAIARACELDAGLREQYAGAVLGIKRSHVASRREYRAKRNEREALIAAGLAKKPFPPYAKDEEVPDFTSWCSAMARNSVYTCHEVTRLAPMRTHP